MIGGVGIRASVSGGMAKLCFVSRNVLSVCNRPRAEAEREQGNTNKDANVNGHRVAITKNDSVALFGAAWEKPSEPSQRNFLKVITDRKFVHENSRDGRHDNVRNNYESN